MPKSLLVICWTVAVWLLPTHVFAQEACPARLEVAYADGGKGCLVDSAIALVKPGAWRVPLAVAVPLGARYSMALPKDAATCPPALGFAVNSSTSMLNAGMDLELRDQQALGECNRQVRDGGKSTGDCRCEIVITGGRSSLARASFDDRTTAAAVRLLGIGTTVVAAATPAPALPAVQQPVPAAAPAPQQAQPQQRTAPVVMAQAPAAAPMGAAPAPAPAPVAVAAAPQPVPAPVVGSKVPAKTPQLAEPTVAAAATPVVTAAAKTPKASLPAAAPAVVAAAPVAAAVAPAAATLAAAVPAAGPGATPTASTTSSPPAAGPSAAPAALASARPSGSAPAFQSPAVSRPPADGVPVQLAQAKLPGHDERSASLAARPAAVPAVAPAVAAPAAPAVAAGAAGTITVSAADLANIRQQLDALRAELARANESASTRRAAAAVPARPKMKTRALVVGNGGYKGLGPLPNAPRDARAVAAKFREFGIEVDLLIDATRDQLVRALGDYESKSAQYDVNIFFYAGHGMQVGGSNYLAPVDLRTEQLSVGSVKLNSVALHDVLEYMTAKTRLVFLDACRDNPVSRTLLASRSASGLGLAPVANVAGGTLISYATRDGSVAEDGEGGNSPYTTALLKHMDAPEDIAVMLRRVRQSVLASTGSRQEPWEYGSLIADEFVLSRIARP